MTTKIEWTQETWNPVTGCSKVSPGCANCYAEAITHRFNRGSLPWTPENAAENVELHYDRLDAPLGWRKPRRVFVNSMSDLFHEQVPTGFIGQVWQVMAETPQHTYQVLTKRPERMFDFVREWIEGGKTDDGGVPDVLPNVWLGVSVENQHWADERIPLLLQTPAAVRFVSCEPLLGPVDLVDPFPTDEGKGPMGEWDYLGHPYTPVGKVYPPFGNRACGFRVRNAYGKTERCGNFEGYPLHRGRHAFLDWVIVGGESGPGHRPFDPEWARSLRDQCRDAGVAFFFKQKGGPRPGMPSGDPELDACKEYPEAQR